MLNACGRLVAALLIAQAPQLPKPTFETGVDLISVDVHVVDKNGKPIADLRPEDFEVDISGRRRKIASAQFVSYAAAGGRSPRRRRSPVASEPGNTARAADVRARG